MIRTPETYPLAHGTRIQIKADVPKNTFAYDFKGEFGTIYVSDPPYGKQAVLCEHVYFVTLDSNDKTTIIHSKDFDVVGPKIFGIFPTLPLRK